MTQTAGKVTEIRSYADRTFEHVAESQKEYRAKLEHVSGFTANHDDHLIQQLEDQAFHLEQSHTRLMDWQRKEKHQTKAWRNEVERRLMQLELKLENEESTGEGDRVHG